MSRVAPTLTIPARFNGPPRSGNGGWTSGALADELLPRGEGEDCPTVEVTLRLPPPLEVPLTLELEEGQGRLRDPEARTVAEARTVDRELKTVDAVDADVAAEAMSRYPGLRNHPFARCFVCGTDREPGDGLQIFPGPVEPGSTASLWVPHPSLAESGDLVDGHEQVGTSTTWAALDCPGGWTEDLEGRPMVLGRMTARVEARPVVGEPHVVVGRLLRQEGRKSFTAATLYDSDGRVVATAEHVWIQLDPTMLAAMRAEQPETA